MPQSIEVSEKAIPVELRAIPSRRAVVSKALQQASQRTTFVLLYLGIILIFLIPYAWMFFSALKTQAEIFKYIYPLSLNTFIPVSPTLQNFWDIFLKLDFGRAMANSLFVATSSVVLALVINSLIAYILARVQFPGRELVFVLVLSSMLIPFDAIIVPLYLVVKNLGMQNTYQALIVPWIASPFGIFLLRQFFMQIPRDLEDAAVIDGCSHFGVYWNVMLPNVRPALVSFALVQFLWSWDSFFWPLVIMQDKSKQVVQVAIAAFSTDVNIFWGWIFAGCAAATLPILILFVILQNYYVKGVIMSGLKG
ncbi:MAG: carbohydrate ABC transporter permease [Chloroflexi bacterium]|nr:carbohydrate ABC transporter permease [Chloroflexota bacterium]MCL5076368.1 carbohydrate ABC transporter permease [Chloroflexota bacterium]